MMRQHPWDDWIPGVLSRRQIRELCGSGYLSNANSEKIDHSSIDLHLSAEGYELLKGSAKPIGGPYLNELERSGMVTPLGEREYYVLEARKTYLFKLQERLHPAILASSIHGQATAKSSVGRVDVLARLIVDGMDSYEGFTPQGQQDSTGDLFLEITPMTFPVKVKPGISLSQLRFFCGSPSDAEVRGEAVYRTLIKDAQRADGMLSVDLSNVDIAGKEACAFRAKVAPGSRVEPIPLWTAEPLPDPAEYWTPEEADENNRLRITGGSFYILRSKERIAVPEGIAVYCRAIDETIGEIRIHYAGFAHPFFGRDREDGGLGTPLIFEVRGHDIDVSLKDGEKLARLIFYRMSEDARMPEETQKKTPYSDQTLQLSKFFAGWSSA